MQHPTFTRRDTLLAATTLSAAAVAFPRIRLRRHKPRLQPVDYDLSGKTAVVTDGTKGISAAIAEKLSNSGAKVHV